MRKEYTIKELTQILGCSRTAIVKKIKEDGDNPSVKRYKNRYEVVISNGQMAILMDDADLEREKSMSRGVNNVLSNGYNTAENDDIIDVEPEKEKNISNELYNFTERYIENLKTLHQHMYNEVLERDKKILLLTTTEETQKKEYLKVTSENIALKKRNTVLTVLLGVTSLVLVGFVTFYITYTILHNTLVTSQEDSAQKKEHAQQEIIIPVEHARVTK